MPKNSMLQPENKIHISEIDEFLATELSKMKKGPLKLVLKKNGNQGYINAFLRTSDERLEDDGIDFELSPSESLDLDNVDINDFIVRPVYTSSAYELFDFLLMYFDSFECLVNFKENAWQVKIVKTNIP